MCYEIGSEIILANLFVKHGKEACKIQELVTVKRKIERKYPDVYVDVTRNSIFSTIENYPNMFCWSKDKIHKSPNSAKFFEPNYVNEYFNNRIDRRDLKRNIKFIISR